MDTFPNIDELPDNVISIEWVRATRTLAAVKVRAIARRAWRIKQRDAKLRAEANKRILRSMGLGPK